MQGIAQRRGIAVDAFKPAKVGIWNGLVLVQLVGEPPVFAWRQRLQHFALGRREAEVSQSSPLPVCCLEPARHRVTRSRLSRSAIRDRYPRVLGSDDLQFARRVGKFFRSARGGCRSPYL